jgi:hypothetical protein
MAERTAKLLPWWLLFGSVIISSVSAFYMFLIRGNTFPLVSSCRPWLRNLWLLDYPGFVLVMVGFVALKPPSLSTLARKMIAIGLFESVALTIITALAPWVGADVRNLAVMGVSFVALITALAFVLMGARRKSTHA